MIFYTLNCSTGLIFDFYDFGLSYKLGDFGDGCFYGTDPMNLSESNFIGSVFLPCSKLRLFDGSLSSELFMDLYGILRSLWDLRSLPSLPDVFLISKFATKSLNLCSKFLK